MRGPVNALYDACCELLDAAQALERSAGVPGSGPGTAAALGCLEASLDALSRSVLAMGGELAHEDLDGLAATLGRAARAADAARARTAHGRAARTLAA